MPSVLDRLAKCSVPRAAAAVLLIVVSWGEGAAWACACDPARALEALREATVIVEGRIEFAELQEDGTIRFSLAVNEVLRGAVQSPVALTTATQDHCGVRVRAGYADTYFYRGDGSTVLQACQALTGLRQVMGSRLAYALRLATLGPGDEGDARRRELQRILGRLDGQELQDFFGVVDRIDPLNEVIARGALTLEYRDIRVRLKDDGTYLTMETAE